MVFNAYTEAAIIYEGAMTSAKSPLCSDEKGRSVKAEALPTGFVHPPGDAW